MEPGGVAAGHPASSVAKFNNSVCVPQMTVGVMRLPPLKLSVGILT